ncbi:MAG: hypothetical protein ACOC1F_05140, partial [Myxococcota bacterium]
ASRRVRAEDEAFGAQLDGAMHGVEQLADERSARVAFRFARAVPWALAGAFACAHPSTPADAPPPVGTQQAAPVPLDAGSGSASSDTDAASDRAPDAPVGADGGARSAAPDAAAPQPAQAPAAPVDAGRPGHDLQVLAERALRGYRCTGGTQRSHAFELSARGWSGARFERFKVTDGLVTNLVMAPSRVRATARWTPGDKKGRQAVIAVFRMPDGREVEQRHAVYQYGEKQATDGAVWRPAPNCRPHPGDPAPPPPPRPFAKDGEVVFTVGGWGGGPSFWPGESVPLGVGLAPGVRGSARRPEVRCTAGRVVLHRSYRNMAGVLHHWGFRLNVVPPDGQLQAGQQTCTFRYRVRNPDGTERTVQGQLRYTIAGDGTLTLSSP